MQFVRWEKWVDSEFCGREDWGEDNAYSDYVAVHFKLLMTTLVILAAHCSVG